MGSLIIMSRIFLGLSVAATIALSGCLLNNSKSSRFKPGTTSSGAGLSQLKLSDAVPSANMPYYLEANSPLEFDENNLSADKIRPMTLNDCIAQALSSSRVMKDLGVTVVRSPQSVTTNLDPALVYTDPRLGEEAALSAFDANLFASSMYEDNDRGLNNRFFGVDGNLRQDLSTSQLGINKRSATATISKRIGSFPFHGRTIWKLKFANLCCKVLERNSIGSLVRGLLRDNSTAFFWPEFEPTRTSSSLRSRFATT